MTETFSTQQSCVKPCWIIRCARGLLGLYCCYTCTDLLFSRIYSWRHGVRMTNQNLSCCQRRWSRSTIIVAVTAFAVTAENAHRNFAHFRLLFVLRSCISFFSVPRSSLRNRLPSSAESVAKDNGAPYGSVLTTVCVCVCMYECTYVRAWVICPWCDSCVSTCSAAQHPLVGPN